MNQIPNKFYDLRIDITAFLRAFVSAIELGDLCSYIDEETFKAKLAIADARSLMRITDGMQEDNADYNIIISCLDRISDYCDDLGLKAMVYEAMAISNRLHALAKESHGTVPVRD